MVGAGFSFEVYLLIAGVLLAISVLASKASSRLGVPILIFFLGIGMLAGSDGPGGLPFSDATLTRNLGTLALAFILFSGGLDTDWRTIRPVFAPGIALATVGVAVSTALVGLFAWKVLGMPPYMGLLLGAIVSSTDASAVFSVLRGRGIHLRHRLGPLLEIESGSNDPMAVFLTIAFTGVVMKTLDNPAMVIPNLLIEMAVGAVVGYIFGRLAVWTINNISLDYDGLYPVLSSGLVLLSYAACHVAHGNGFLSVYVTGVVMGSNGFLRKGSLKQFHDGLAWLMQVVMFITLGLLVFPTKLPEVAGMGIGLALFLVLIARPIAVFLALIPFRRLDKSDKLFVSWVGLRGAVPIVLATVPMTAGVPDSHRLFHLVFFVVIGSVLLQGTTIAVIAKKLGVISAGERRGSGRTAAANGIELTLTPDSPAVGRRLVDLNVPNTALVVLVTRRGRSFVPQGATAFEAGDKIQIATRKQDLDDLQRLLVGKQESS